MEHGERGVGTKTYPSFLTLKEGSTFLTKPLFPQGREDVAGSAIAPPGFWSVSGALCPKGLAGSAYAIKLRLLDATGLRVFVGWRINAVAYPPLWSPKRSCCLIRSGYTWGQWEGVSFAIVAIRYNWLLHIVTIIRLR